MIINTSNIYPAPPTRLSHKAAINALNAFAEKLTLESNETEALEAALHESIMEHPVLVRKPRVHPREIKRRPKNYKLTQMPRQAARKLVA